MCSSCRAGYGNGAALAAQGYTTIIPTKTYVSEITYSDFMLWRCYSERKFMDALRTIAIDNQGTTLADKVKTADDVRKLANYADTRQDIAKWNVNLKNLLGNIRFTPEEQQQASCKFAFSNNS